MNEAIQHGYQSSLGDENYLRSPVLTFAVIIRKVLLVSKALLISSIASTESLLLLF